MATILRDWSYRYQWLYDAVARLSALSVGGEARFRQLALEGLTIDSQAQVLDLCCGSGQTTQFLVQRSAHVTGLDASPRSIQRARQNVPQAKYVEGWAEAMPFADHQFDFVHTSVALHEMRPDQLRQILSEVYRVLKPQGTFALIDFHPPKNLVMQGGLTIFLWLFETETAWQLLRTSLVNLLQETGFQVDRHTLHAGGSLQTLQSKEAVMQNTAEFFCAYCGEPNLTFVDLSAGGNQSYTEDCQVCCRPNVLYIHVDEDTLEIEINSEYEG